MLCRHRLKSEVSCRLPGRVKAAAALDPPRSSLDPLTAVGTEVCS